MKNIAVLVDGLNLFHALKNFGAGHERPDIRLISAKYMNVPAETLDIFYFSSAPQHLGRNAMDEYFALKKLLVGDGVTFREGRFQALRSECGHCGSMTEIHREKETDVSIALKIAEIAMKKTYDQLLLFSADSDLAPALEFLNRESPNTRLVIAQTGLYLRNASYSLASKADSTIRIHPAFIHTHQLKP